MTYLKNWRDIQPQVYHLSAVVWGGWFQQEEEGEEEEASPQVLSGFARHALQGRKTSDYHKHENMEQVYYVLSGRGEVLYEDTRYAVEEGDAVYLPSGTHHQMFNDEEDWLEHHVISMKVQSDGGEFAIRNWRQVAPQGTVAGPCAGANWEPKAKKELVFCGGCPVSNARPCSLGARRESVATRSWSSFIGSWKRAARCR